MDKESMDDIFTVRKELFDNHLFQTISVAIKLMPDFFIYHTIFYFIYRHIIEKRTRGTVLYENV